MIEKNKSGLFEPIICRSLTSMKNNIRRKFYGRENKKAVIPSAGLGTRFLPATKAQPKKMLPILISLLYYI